MSSKYFFYKQYFMMIISIMNVKDLKSLILKKFIKYLTKRVETLEDKWSVCKQCSYIELKQFKKYPTLWELREVYKKTNQVFSMNNRLLFQLFHLFFIKWTYTISIIIFNECFLNIETISSVF